MKVERSENAGPEGHTKDFGFNLIAVGIHWKIFIKVAEGEGGWELDYVYIL